jgi:hypothetical protein
VCDLRVEAFTLPTIHSMIEFAPSSFADGGEIALITKTAREQGGGDRLGKAERYLLEMSQVPKIESLLRVLQLLLSFGDVKDQTMQAANVLNRATTEVGERKISRNPCSDWKYNSSTGSTEHHSENYF